MNDMDSIGIHDVTVAGKKFNKQYDIKVKMTGNKYDDVYVMTGEKIPEMGDRTQLIIGKDNKVVFLETMFVYSHEDKCYKMLKARNNTK